MKPSSILRFFGVAFLLLLSARLPIFAQQQAAIVGTVTDATGAVVPNVQITLTNEATRQNWAATTNGEGGFSAPYLPIGTYSVSGVRTGFKDFKKTHIALNLDDTVRVDMRLQPGAANETVTVVANTVQVQSDSNEISSLIDSKQISQLDTNGRSMAGLVTLSPGVTSSNADFYLPTRSGSYSINGGTNISNLFLVDGTEDMDRGSDGSNISPSPDALSEFKVLTSNYSPDYGFAGGGIIAVALKSGTRDFHGDLWEYVRNDDLNANNYFSNLAHTVPPELRFNTYGGNLGGPLFIPHHFNQNRSKTFFFVNEEWRRIVQATVLNDTLPTAQEYTGNFSDRSTKIYVPSTVGDPAKLAQFASLGLVPGTPFPNNQIPASLIDPNVKLFLGAGAFPLPTTGSQFIGNSTTLTLVREDIVRLDHTFNDKLMFNAHLLHFIANQVESMTALIGTLPSATTPIVNPAWNGAFKLTEIIHPRLINQVVFNVEGNSGYDGLSGVWQEPPGWSVNNLFPNTNSMHVLPNLSISSPYSGGSFGVNQLPIFAGATEFQEGDDLFWNKGAHNFKFGGSFAHYTKDQTDTVTIQGVASFGGAYTAEYASNGSTLVAGNSFADMLLGLESSGSDSAIKPESHLAQEFGGAYAMDDWRIRNRFTLNLGARWNSVPHGFEKYNQTSTFIPGDYNPANAGVFTSSGSISPTSPGITTFSSAPGSNIALSTIPFYANGMVLAGRNGLSRSMVNNSWLNFEPRVGFAYDLLGNNKTILRGGGGTFYQVISSGDSLATAGNLPFVDTASVSHVYFSNPSISTLNGQSIGAFPILAPTIVSMAANYPAPRSGRWSLGIQQQLNPVSVFTVAYVGATGWHQQTEQSINYVPLNDPNRAAIIQGTYNGNLDSIYKGYSGITQWEASGTFHYNSLQSTLRLQSRRGYAVHFAYTYSKALGLTSGVQSNPYSTRYDWGPTSLDQRHVFVADYVVPIPLPSSWSSSLVRQTLGGWQITGITYMQGGFPLTPTLSTNGAIRPNQITPLTYPKTRLQWFNTASYAVPTFLSFGNASAFSIRQPGRDNWNMALFKTFDIAREKGINLQFRADAYNTFNHTQFNTVQTAYTSSTFGQVLTAYDPRVFQLSMRFGF